MRTCVNRIDVRRWIDIGDVMKWVDRGDVMREGKGGGLDGGDVRMGGGWIER